MKNLGKKLIAIFLTLAICVPQVCFAALYDNGSEYTWDGKYYAAYKQSDKDISIAYTANINGNFAGETSGGVARAYTALKDIRGEYPDSYLFDAGDFSGGGDIFSSDTKDSYPLDIMSKATYNAVALGANELSNEHFIDVIDGANDNNSASGEKMPKLMASNIKCDDKLKDKIDSNGSTEYKVIKKYNSKIGVFAINDSADSDALKKNDIELKDPKDTANEVASKLKNEGVDLVVCLYSGKKVEASDSAEDFAKKIEGVDLVISGTSSSEAKEVGSTIIAGVSDKCAGLGHIVLTKNDEGKFQLNKCSEKKLDSSIEENESILEVVAKHQKEYFKTFGYDADGKLTTNDVTFTPIENFGKEQGDDNLGNIISDSFLYAAGKEENKDIKGTCSVVASGAVKNSIKEGRVTPSSVFAMFGKDAGTDKLAGIDMVKVYVTGAELRLLGEVDVSLSNEENGLRLYTSGLGYEYNPHRFYLNHVSDYWYGNKKEKIDDEELYGLVMDSDTLQILREGNSSPLGLLDIKYKDAHGNVIEDFDKAVIKSGDRNLKAWETVAKNLYDNDIDSSYAKPAGHKVLNDSTDLSEIFKNPGKSFIFVVCVAILSLAILILMIILIVHIVRKVLKVPPKSKYNSLYMKNKKEAPIFKHRRNRYRDRTRRRR